MKERRKFKRTPCGPFDCQIRFDLAKHPGAIIEESIGGLKLSGLDLLVVPENCPITVEHMETQQSGVVRSVSRQNGKLQLGVSLQQSVPENQRVVENLLLGCYIYEDEQLVACHPIALESDGRVLVELWDGQQRIVPRDQLTPLTRGERRQILEATAGHVAHLLSIYDLESEDDATKVDAILIFEFCVQEHAPA